MKTETPQEQLKRIGKELEEVSFERFWCDTSVKGQARWEELWARGEELLKQYKKLKEKIDAQSVAASSTTMETTA